MQNYRWNRLLQRGRLIRVLWCEHSSSPKALILVEFLFSDTWLGNAICFKMIEHFSELQEKATHLYGHDGTAYECKQVQEGVWE